MVTKTEDNQKNPEQEEVEEAHQETLETSTSNEEESKAEEKKEPTPMEQLQEQIRLKDEEIANQKDTFLREKAELENFKKRLTKEKDDFVQFANERLLQELIQIEDNLERALEVPNATLESLKEGVEMIQKQFSTFLKNQKVESIEAIGKEFDPTLHEVLNQQESEEHEENTVIEEFSKGYTLNGRILRPAKVVISKKPAEKKEDS